MIVTFLEGIARREALNLSIPGFFAILFACPGDSLLKVVSSLLYSCFLLWYFRTLFLICSHFFFPHLDFSTCLILDLFHIVLSSYLFAGLSCMFPLICNRFTFFLSSFLHSLDYFRLVFFYNEAYFFLSFQPLLTAGPLFAWNCRTVSFVSIEILATTFWKHVLDHAELIA